MPYATTKDNVKLYYEEVGHGSPILFCHEFAGDYRNWEPQMRFLSRRHRCIAYSARGYKPSDVPKDWRDYSYKHWSSDAVAVLDHLRIDKAHVVGLSMGGYTVIQVGLDYPDRALSLVAAGAGSGSERAQIEEFRKHSKMMADEFIAKGAPEVVRTYGLSPARIPFQVKDPRGFDEFKRMLAEHSALGARNTQLGVQRERPSLYDLLDQMKALTLPTLILTGDEDWPCLAPGLLMKQTITTAALSVMPNCGHAINIEDPDEFNRLVGAFITQVDAGRWPSRDPRAVSASITGMR